MRILLLGDTYLPERAAGATRASELAMRWREKGHVVTVVSGNPHYPTGRIFPGYSNRLLSHDVIEGIPVERVFTVPYTRDSIAKRVVNQILFGFVPALMDRVGETDIVVASSPPLTIGVPGWLMARRRRVPFVFDVRDLYPEAALAYGVLREGLVARMFRALASFIYRRADRLVIASRFWAGMVATQGVPAGKIHVIHNGANVERFRPTSKNKLIRAKYGIPEEDFLFGYVGLLGRAHGARVIVEAAEKLRDNAGVHLLLVGEGADKVWMQSRAREAGLTNITFAPSVPAAEVPTILNACDGGLATLRAVDFTRGAIPVKIFELMACGLPVVLAGHGETEEIVRAAGAGLVVPCEDGAKLAGALIALARDRNMARSMGEQGRAFVEQNFSRRMLADRFETVLEEAVTVRRGRDAVKNEVGAD